MSSRTTRYPSSWIERSTLVVLLILAMRPRIVSSSSDAVIAIIGMLGITAMLYAHRRSRPLRRPPVELILLALALGLTWLASPHRMSSALQLSTLLLVGFVAIRLGQWYPQSTTADAMSVALSVLMTLSVLLILSGVGYAQDPNLGSDFRGVFVAKNLIGIYGGLHLVLAFLQPGLRLRTYGASISTFAMVLVSSRGGLLAAVLVIAFVVALRALLTAKHEAARPWVFFLTAATIAGGTLAGPSFVFRVLGRDDRFSGRTDIWAYSLEAFRHRPIAGYGYNVYWAAESPLAIGFRSTEGWQVPSSHNMYLEALLWGGILGLLVVVLLLVVALVRLAAGIRRSDALVTSSSALVLYVFVVGIVENVFPSWNWFIVVTCVMMFQYARSHDGSFRWERRNTPATGHLGSPSRPVLRSAK